MTTSSSLHRTMAIFLLGEALFVEIGSGGMAWMSPATSIALLFDGKQDEDPSMALIFMTANFGLLCMALGFAIVWIALGVLQDTSDGLQSLSTMQRLVVGLAVGDLCNVYHVATVLVPYLGEWTTTALQSAGTSAFLCLVRCIYLMQCARMPNKPSKDL